MANNSNLKLNLCELMLHNNELGSLSSFLFTTGIFKIFWTHPEYHSPVENGNQSTEIMGRLAFLCASLTPTDDSSWSESNEHGMVVICSNARPFTSGNFLHHTSSKYEFYKPEHASKIIFIVYNILLVSGCDARQYESFIVIRIIRQTFSQLMLVLWVMALCCLFYFIFLSQHKTLFNGPNNLTGNENEMYLWIWKIEFVFLNYGIPIQIYWQ